MAELIRAIDLDRYCDPMGYTVQVDEEVYDDGTTRYFLYCWQEDSDVQVQLGERDGNGELLVKREVSSLHEGLGEMAACLAYCKGEYDAE